MIERLRRPKVDRQLGRLLQRQIRERVADDGCTPFSLMKLDDLRFFLAVARTHSLSEAGRRLAAKEKGMG